MALVHHLDRGSPDILSLTLFHLSPFFSPAEQLLDPSCGGASEKQSMQSNAHEKSLKHITTQQQLNIILVQDGQIFTSLNSFTDFFKRN